jgi:hypothetical protein
MASEGPNSGGTFVNDNSIGTTAWTNPGNAMASDNVYAWEEGSNAMTFFPVKIVKGGSIVGSGLGGGTGVPLTDTYVTFGNTTELWGQTWTASNINASDFGVVVAMDHVDGNDSQYLKATNFGFSIPTDATIDGIKVEVEADRNGPNTDFNGAEIDHIRITVYYTEVTGTNAQINIGDAWKSVDAMKINIGDAWKDVAGAQINIGDVWKTIF